MELLNRVVEIAANPTGSDYFVGVSAHPDISGAEVAAIGIGVANAIDNGHLAVVVKLLKVCHVGIESQASNWIDREQIALWDRQVGP